jgi:hypothetical protein
MRLVRSFDSLCYSLWHADMHHQAENYPDVKGVVSLNVRESIIKM